MRHIQFQTDTQYLCFNHAVQQVQRGVMSLGDKRTVWGETLPKGKFEPRCEECTVEAIQEDAQRDTKPQ